MLGAVGDLLEDVRVVLGGPVNLASDTSALITRRRGGSAANVAAVAAAVEGRARFVGQVGDDGIGDLLIAELERDGVDVAARRAGRTGTIVVLVDERGERTMLSDRGAAPDLASADTRCLDGLHSLHVPFYSLRPSALAVSARALIGAAHGRDIAVSIDLSSTAEMQSHGIGALVALLRDLAPDVVFANEDEAALLGDRVEPGALGARSVVVHGPGGATVFDEDRQVIPTSAIDLTDTTGAGDAFAAGFMVARAGGAPTTEAAAAGHAAAGLVLGVTGASPDPGAE